MKLFRQLFVCLLVMIACLLPGCGSEEKNEDGIYTFREWEADVIKGAYISDEEYADALLAYIIEVIEDQNSDALKSMFAPESVDNCNDIDSQIQSLLQFYDGELVTVTRYGPQTSQSKNGNHYIKEIDVSFNITTTLGAYRLAMRYRVTDTQNEDSIGVHSLYIISAGNSDIEFAYWGGDVWKPGIIIE